MSKKFLPLFALAALLCAAISGGGCGGSSSGGGNNSDIERISIEMTGLTTNDEGVPHVFALPDDAEQVIISNEDIKAAGGIRVLKKDQADEHDWGMFGDPIQIKSVLFPPRAVNEQSVDSSDVTISRDVRDADVFEFQLQAGVLYTVELSRNLIHGTDGFIPDLTIRDASVSNGQADEDVDSGAPAPDDEEDPAGESLETGLITDFSFTAEPKGGAPAVMLWTFIPKKSGVHEIRVSNAEHQFDEGRKQMTDYMLRVYKEQGVEGNYGHPIALIVEGQDLTLGEVLTLRDALVSTGVERPEQGEEEARPEVLQTDMFGLPIVPEEFRDKEAASVGALADDSSSTGNNGPLTKYQTRMDTMMMVKGAVSDESYLSPVISGVKPYENNEYMDFGDGYMAITGLRGYQVSAVDVTDKTLPPISEPQEEYSYSFISSKQDQINETSLTVKGSYSAVAATIKTENTISEKVQYSDTSTTLVVRYFYREGKWAKPNDDLSAFKLTDKAKNFLQTYGQDKFRENFGDYFVVGHRRGAQIDAYITIKTSSSSKINEIKSTLGVKGGKWETSEEFQKKVTKALEGTETQIFVKNYGSMPTSKPLPTTIDGLNKYIDEFAAAVRDPKFQFVTLDVELRSYASVFGDELFPTMLNVPQDHFVNLNSFCDDIMELNAQYHTLASIPTDNLASGSRQQTEWGDKYSDMKKDIEAKMVDICGTKEALAAKHAELKTLIDEFTTLNERWAFYKQLLAAQEANINDHKDQGFGTWGFRSFNSEAVMADFLEPIKHSYKKGYKAAGKRSWDIAARVGTKKLFDDPYPFGVWTYLRTTRYSKGGYVNQDLPSIGSHWLYLHFKSAYSRGGNWEFEAVGFNLDPQRYPFYGLTSNNL